MPITLSTPGDDCIDVVFRAELGECRKPSKGACCSAEGQPAREMFAKRSHEDVQRRDEKTQALNAAFGPHRPCKQAKKKRRRSALEAVPARGAYACIAHLRWLGLVACCEAFRRHAQSQSLMHVARTPFRSGAPATTACRQRGGGETSTDRWKHSLKPT